MKNKKFSKAHKLQQGKNYSKNEKTKFSKHMPESNSFIV